MTAPANPRLSTQRHRGPHLGALAIVITVLFCAGLYPVTLFGGMPYFPGPWESQSTIVHFFDQRPDAVVLCAFLQFGAMIPLGIYTATIVSRLRFLGINAAGPYIALFGGFSVALIGITGSALLWAMVRPGVALDQPLLIALYYFGYAIGGPGFSTTFGLLLAGVSVPALMRRLVPRWIAILGIVLAVCGELGWLNLELPKTLFFIPLTRFPGFVWLIAMGFALPATVKRATPAAAE
jgi:hypothetical protein